ncbi:hypothetical protein Apar_0093 [Lancefieldella parvula DSM 20469]|uniref:Uncharacterized protein n=1 Tax=Lancefieldella parvula (strain ATCC 33793 / DSM 20469 / CCUG 32760 / JCM 10300 / KCTC 3663 / VPI 0546 / 1246) TaxID=521095 RepID=C8W8U1_LANP1|nr:hypothetical protein [Lancefieldella parvula]ACV50529.1 hypothetical protein Apar_0093 [Lancefieldella parvula DSM 20469]
MRDLLSLQSKIQDVYVRQIYCEAVASYNAQAYRSAILTAWLAVYVDLMKKIESIGGNKIAEEFQTKVNKMRLEKNDSARIKSALDIEKGIISTAKDLSLIDEAEEKFLRELHECRHKCAHPTTDDTVYIFEPTEEQVRYLLSGVIDNCLSFSALPKNNQIIQILMNDLSKDFPLEQDLFEFYKSKYIDKIPQNTQRQLIKIIAIEAVCPSSKEKWAECGLEISSPDLIAKRCMQILKCINTFSKDLLIEVFTNQSKKLSNGDSSYRFVGVFSSFDFFRDHLDRDLYFICKAKFNKAIESEYDKPWELLLNGFPYDQELREESEKLFNSDYFLSHEKNLTELSKNGDLDNDELKKLVDCCIDKLEKSSSYSEADYLARLIVELAPVLEGNDILKISAILFKNNQVFESFSMDRLIKNIALNSMKKETANYWKEFAENGMEKKKPELLNPDLSPSYDSVMKWIYNRAIEELKKS